MAPSSKYTDAVLNAFIFNPKHQDIVEKKKEILSSILKQAQSETRNILFFGYNPMIHAVDGLEIFITDTSTTVRDYLTDVGINFTYIETDELLKYSKKFNIVVALDEFFTFASDETDQKDKIDLLCDLCDGTIVTSLRDYKNLSAREREFSSPAAVRNKKDNRIYLEHHNHNIDSKVMWSSSLYEITGDSSNTVLHYGPYERMTMYFKQLAKFSYDAGATGFLVHKDLMYKSPVKKNYEHVISIKL